ncbi:MAG: glycosyltransferase family 2 protein [Candidatus Omnitrophica bacterium]|nr:glycosyltransferase family 2 protein [Candidatus Omnitrophota bacterium]MBU1872001.1 glycosyltransferase family 2 protein [Candidatus Omnitrophota bacterium]
MNNIEVVIPAYNEEKTIAKVIQGIRKVLGDSCLVIVVDDASEDTTAEIARKQGARVISHPYHIGNGASVKSGLREARAELVLLMDGDGQHLPEDLPGLLEKMPGFDMVIGARNFSGYTLRNLANRLYNLFASYVTQFKILDLTSGFRLVKRNEALRFLYLLPNGFSYPTTLTLTFLKTGRTINYVSVSSGSRRAGRSKIRHFSDGIKFLLIITRISTLFSPLRVFLPVSIIFFLSGLFYYLYTFITTHRFTNMAVFLLSSSVIVFMLGLISEQISQLRMDKTEDAP